ncbi:MAG: hypothetical protein COS99_07145 [Candidatus Omnitrophica bacterium CG07_land_8_20_14_0_80_42_15]|uniref:Galactosyldiacylglycerol synthase n=1 Tax=Candidatus Aquitaenariimonas noxiae TaxID=1974741 RepID=A0A2J0KRU1_9BACT|nr:MAG: hypothetical protein COS99_07145 [Candidatus Omnitrophica bacterium CG07_land_8_20_14_0_80_42_15]
METKKDKKILICYATAGIGHMKAALAVEDALVYKGNKSYEIIDILDYSNAFLKWLYRRFYIILVQYTPSLWALVYYTLDIPWIYNLTKGLRTLTDTLNAKKFIDYICASRPDIIISTHFFSSEVVSFLKRKNIARPYLVSVITDFKLHTYWVSKEIDLFVVGNDALKEHLKRFGIDEEKIKVLGIPIELRFYQQLDKDILYQKLGIKKGLFTILIASGGFGVGPVKKIIEQFSKANIDVQIMVVCGKNKVLFEDIKKLQNLSKIPIKVYGFVDNMHELMEVADLLISKSGGMTASEAIAKGLPMIAVLPIPGQEMRNCQFLIENRVAIREDNPYNITKKVAWLFNNKEELNIMKKKTLTIKKPNPALSLAEIIEKI